MNNNPWGTCLPRWGLAVLLQLEMRKLSTSQDSTPKCYLSTSEGHWRVINQGMPVCKDMPSREQALAAAKQVAVTPTALWDGDEGAFKSLDAQDCSDGEPSPGAARLPADPKAMDLALRRDQIATLYATEMQKAYGGGHNGIPSEIHARFADAILSKNAYALEHLANGMNGAAKAVFTAVTGIALPKQQAATWKAIRAWAGVSDAADAVVKAMHKVHVERKFLETRVHNPQQTHDWIRQRILMGFNRLVNEQSRWLLANEAGNAYDLSKKGTGFAKARALIAAELALADAQAALAAEQGTPASLALAA